MKALILNSGTGSRMGDITKTHPKCMTEIGGGETILSRQLRQLAEAGVQEAVITTGEWDQKIREACEGCGLKVTFVLNPRARETNYIYSMYLAREALKGSDILLMHGDLVFESRVLDDVMASPVSCMAVSSTLPLPEKDFKAVIKDGRIREIGIQVPVCAGLMPVTSGRQMKRIVSMSGAFIPQSFTAMVDRFGGDDRAMSQAGILYTSEQIVDLLANGVKHIHVYTMNKPEVARAIMQNISEIWKYEVSRSIS